MRRALRIPACLVLATRPTCSATLHVVLEQLFVFSVSCCNRSGTAAGKATTSSAQSEPQVITDDLLAEAFAFAEAASKPPPKKPQDAAVKGST
ncbi:uncharacterized protein JCM10292_004313 [Rhodotorula paludigena]|uniref:uncharacterized protein n=1 Tax=Rhodotorula paludigena TaxID=86838 RepID=UPI003177D74B